MSGNSTRDAIRADDAETFLAHWPGSKHLSDEHREDFIAAWTGWHRGADFERECDERDAIAEHGLSAFGSGLAWCLGCAWSAPNGPDIRTEHAVHVSQVISARAAYR